MATKSMQDSLENRKSDFGFDEYAETVGPQGLLFVLKGTGVVVFTLHFTKSIRQRQYHPMV